jgi:hypothetical protein
MALHGTRLSSPSKTVLQEEQYVRTFFENDRGKVTQSNRRTRQLKLSKATTTMDHQETAGKKNHSPDGLCSIKTAPTEDSTADDIEATRHFTPVQNSDEHFTTLNNIKISYEMLGLIPTKMRPMPDVLDQMKADGVWDIDIEEKQTDEEVEVFRLIVFSTAKTTTLSSILVIAFHAFNSPSRKLEVIGNDFAKLHYHRIRH